MALHHQSTKTMLVSQKQPTIAAIVASLGLTALLVMSIAAPEPHERYIVLSLVGILLLFLRMRWLREWCGPDLFQTKNTYLLQKKMGALLVPVASLLWITMAFIVALVKGDGDFVSYLCQVFLWSLLIWPLFILFFCVVSDSVAPTLTLDMQRLEADVTHNMFLQVYSTMCIFQILVNDFLFQIVFERQPETSKEEVWFATSAAIVYAIVAVATFLVTSATKIGPETVTAAAADGAGLTNSKKEEPSATVEPSTDYHDMV